jgi:hypothetical protein
MRPLVIVKPDEAFDGTTPMPEGPPTLQGQAFVINGAKEALNLTIRLGSPWPQQMMSDAQAPAGLLESRQPVAVVGISHRERQSVIGQHGFDAIWQAADHLLEKGRRRHTRLLGCNRDDGFPAEIVDSREFVVIPGVSKRRQDLDIEMQQLAGSALLVAPDRTTTGARQSGLPVARQNAMYGLRADADQGRDPRRAKTATAQLQHSAYRPLWNRGRTVRAPRAWCQRVQAAGLNTLPPPRQYLAWNPEFATQVTQRSALHVLTDQKRTNLRAMGHATWHEPPPGGSSYEL